MKRLILILACFPVTVRAQEIPTKPWTSPDDVTFRPADINSEGTRMAAEVFAPRNPKSAKLPTIVMSHGWGGTAAALRPDAIVFARAGYLVVAFDYRGWGKSDSRLIQTDKKPVKKNGKLFAEVKEVRGVVDPIDQTTDIMNAIHWVAGEKQCDSDRIGIWGSSFSGGHVVYVAARDPRVKAFVSQVGAMDARWTIANPAIRTYAFSQGTARTQGKIGYPKPGAKFNNMTGQPVWEKLMQYAPIEDIGRCKNCAMLFIIAEKEELFDNKDHAILAHERAPGVKKLVTIQGIKHYGIYREARGQAQKEAIAWFDAHLKGETPSTAVKGKAEVQGTWPQGDPAVLAAWKKAGAEVGWMRAPMEFGSRLFHTEGQPKNSDLLAFRFTAFKSATLAGLPQPGVPFGLSFQGTKITDADLKELAGMKRLQVLNLSDSKITDAGLKELAGMKHLEALNLLYTKVTDAGLEELAGLKLKTLWIPFACQTDLGLQHYLAAVDPRSLNLNGWRKITDAGFKELGRLSQVRALYLSDTKITDAGLKTLTAMKKLRTLDLSDTALTDAGMKEVAGLEQLQALSIQYTKTTDAGIKELAGLKQLQALNLQHTKTTDDGLKELVGLAHLRSLNLRYTMVTDVGLKELGKVAQLQALNLYDTKVSDAGLKELTGLTHLQSLNLNHCQITDAGMKEFARMDQLRRLDLSLTKITDAGLKELAGLTQLRSLNLRYAKITDAGLKEFAGMKKLRALDLHQTGVTDRGVAQLQRSLPECAIAR